MGLGDGAPGGALEDPTRAPPVARASATREACHLLASMLAEAVKDRCFFFSSRRRHTRLSCDWSSDVCSSDLMIRIRDYRVTGVQTCALPIDRKSTRLNSVPIISYAVFCLDRKRVV